MARTFGASQEQAALTRLITGTLPIGLAESTVTQADLILAFFLLCTAEWLLAWRKSGRLHDSALMSIAAGLALATKNTGYLIELPFGLWFLAAVLQKERRRILSILICAVLVLLPNAPTYLRNSAYGGSLLGHTGFVNATTDWGLGPFVLNAVRNAAVHFATPVDRVNRLLTAALVHGLAFVGLDANDPNVTYDLGGAGQPFGLSTIRTGDETAPNPIHVLLCVTATIFFLLGRNSSETAPRYYAMCVTAAVGVFLILLKWNLACTRFG